jgi:hypothetical protein
VRIVKHLFGVAVSIHGVYWRVREQRERGKVQDIMAFQLIAA